MLTGPNVQSYSAPSSLNPKILNSEVKFHKQTLESNSDFDFAPASPSSSPTNPRLYLASACRAHSPATSRLSLREKTLCPSSAVQSTLSDPTAKFVDLETPMALAGDTLWQEAATNAEGSNVFHDQGSGSSVTYHDHEPFATFSPKILQLCTATFTDRKVQDISVEHISGGSFNRIVGVNIAPSVPEKFTLPWFWECVQKLFGYEQKKETESLVIRIPRCENNEMSDDIAAFRFAHKHLGLPIPRVLRFDTTMENVISSPYMFQNRIPGQNLVKVINTLNVEQSKSLMRQMVEVYCKLQNITHHSAGTIAPSFSPDSREEAQLNELTIQVGFGASQDNTRNQPSTSRTTLTLLLNLCNQWIQYEGAEDCMVEMIWSKFVLIAKSMHSLGFIPDTDKFHFCHLDLYSRNILVQIISNSTVKVTGLLDWDAQFAMFAPKFVALRPLSWMWVDEEHHESNEMVATDKPSFEQFREVKALFEELAGEEWCKYAYAPEYLIARRMFDLLRDGVHNTDQYRDAEAVIEEWQALHPTKGLDLEYDMDIEEAEESGRAIEDDDDGNYDNSDE